MWNNKTDYEVLYRKISSIAIAVMLLSSVGVINFQFPINDAFADKLIIEPFSEPGKIFKVDKVFKYPKNVGKTDRRDVQTIKAMMDTENTKAQKK